MCNSTFKWPEDYLVAWNFCGSINYFCVLTIFCVLWELIFAIRTDWFFLLGKSIQHWYIFSNNTAVCDVKPVFVSLYTALSLNEETSCNWTDTVSFTVFLCGKLKLFAGTYFCGSLEKSGQKRNNCVPHGSASKEIHDNQNWLTSHARASLRYGVTVGSLCHPKIYSLNLC